MTWREKSRHSLKGFKKIMEPVFFNYQISLSEVKSDEIKLLCSMIDQGYFGKKTYDIQRIKIKNGPVIEAVYADGRLMIDDAVSITWLNITMAYHTWQHYIYLFLTNSRELKVMAKYGRYEDKWKQDTQERQTTTPIILSEPRSGEGFEATCS